MQGLQWSENVNSQGKHYLYNENTGQPHACKPVLKPNPISLYDYVGGIAFDKKPESLALTITTEALRCNLDPFKVRTERKGAFIILH